MSLLSDFEDRVGRAIEGVFAGVFRAPVQPAELARAAGKEMDRRRKLGVGKVYAPTLYSILLSPEDAEQLGGFERTLAGELETYLVGYARERDYTLSARPRVRFLVDDELRLGRYEIIGELMSPEQLAEELRETDERAEAPDAELNAAVPTVAPGWATAHIPPALEREPAGLATITVPGIAHDIALGGDRMVVGRLRSCEIHLEDVNASREHAALEREGTGWALVDLTSTNGTLVNGRRVDRVLLDDGDIITIGVSELVYHEPRG